MRQTRRWFLVQGRHSGVINSGLVWIGNEIIMERPMGESSGGARRRDLARRTGAAVSRTGLRLRCGTAGGKAAHGGKEPVSPDRSFRAMLQSSC